MSELDILFAPHPTLKKKAKPVDVFNKDLKTLAEDMLETMYAAPGIGLAANQVNSLQRIFVMDCSTYEEDPAPYIIVNPQITWVSEETGSCEEGCLSIPEQYAVIERPLEVKIFYQDINGTNKNAHFIGLEATCAQHEIDHLNGRLFLDHLTALKRNMMMQKLKKTLKERKNESPQGSA